MNNRLLYITVSTPLGTGEEFILKEMLALRELKVGLFVVPRNPAKKLFHPEALPLLEDSLRMGLLNLRIAMATAYFFFRRFSELVRIVCDLIQSSRTWKQAVKNLLVVPKALYVSLMRDKQNTVHIHAHWGSTPATMAYVISRITGIPWSMTLHRGDICQNNLLTLKVQTAAFVRCVSEEGRTLLLRRVGKDFAEKIKVIHMGVAWRDGGEPRSRPRSPFVIATPANLLPVKGHRYLIDACSILVSRGFVNFKCSFFGEGTLRRELERLIIKKGLNDFIEMPGHIPHMNLLQMYQQGRVSLVVLPSINTDDGEHEGIPVCLMEAMAYGVPVVSTKTGGTSELLDDGCGILCEEKDAAQLANAIQVLLSDPDYYRTLRERGRLKIKESFEITKCTKELLRLIEATR